MHVKPAAGLLVINPSTQRQIPEAGIEVSDQDLWALRALSHGDLQIVPEVKTEHAADGEHVA